MRSKSTPTVRGRLSAHLRARGGARSSAALRGESRRGGRQRRSEVPPVRFGDEAPLARRVEHDLDPARRSVLLEPDDRGDGAAEPARDLANGAHGALALVLGDLGVVCVNHDVHLLLRRSATTATATAAASTTATTTAPATRRSAARGAPRSRGRRAPR